MTALAVIILTYNEALHLERAIRSVAPLAGEVFVIDSGSTDDTVAIAERLGAQVLVHPFVSQAAQFQWALDHAPVTADWVMRLDADEIIEADLVAVLADRLASLPTGVTGIDLQRKHIFMGRWIRHGGRYPLTMLRVWRYGKARIEQRWMDEHMVLIEGQAVVCKGGFADVNLQDLSFFTDKHNRYASREAIDILNQRYGLFTRDEALVAGKGEAASKRWFKERFYNRLPFWVGPTCYFLYRYFLQLGFLDGREGLIYHGLQGWWYRFLVGAKVEEWDRQLRGLNGRAARLERLSQLSGYRLG